MKNATILSAGLAALLLSGVGRADGITWQYLDARYQQPADDDTRGVAGQLSVNIAPKWVIQSGASYVRLKESSPDLKVSQTRLDLSVGRVFDFSDRVSALLSAGYTHLRYDVNVGEFDGAARDNLGNLQVILRAVLARRLEAEASLGMLFDDEETSDALWNAGVRYHLTPSASVLVGANGIASDAFDSDDVLYEIGFRFDLSGR